MTTETTMDATTDHHRLVARLQQRAAGAGYRIVPSPPLVKFVNLRTGGVVITRDAQTYRSAPDWEERVFDRSRST